MSQIEQIKTEIERRISEHTDKEICDEAAIELDKLLDFIENIEKEQKLEEPQGLDEAAKEYANIQDEGDKEKYVNGYLYNGFYAGAKWMAEQGISFKSVILPYNGLKNISEFPEDCFDNFEYDDKIIVQIRKAEN